MVDPENHTIKLLKELRAHMDERFDKIETDFAELRTELDGQFQTIVGLRGVDTIVSSQGRRLTELERKFKQHLTEPIHLIIPPVT